VKGHSEMTNDNILTEENDSDIAVIGMAGRFPGANSVDELWQTLCAGIESISFFSDQELREAGVDAALLNDPNYVRASSVLDDPALFDASFFGYTPREAQMMDPQHRLFLECAWEALEHAGYDADLYEGRIGVYGGALINTYLLWSGLLSNFVTDYLLILLGNHNDYLTTRVSYKLNLRGPSVGIQTACSTSLVAVHVACQSLLNEECDIALAGGVSVRVPHRVGYLYQEGSIVSPDGHCRAFDARAQGTVFGSGVGIVVVKRLADAIVDGDCIHAVIKGAAINNDGSSKVSYTAPSVDSQSEVIVEALANAGIGADTVTYVEAHGTGTTLGDPIEAAALTKAFRVYTDKRGFCAIGSVKTNIGHLDNAAGVAGLIKTILALEHNMIPPSLHFEEPNPEIDFENSPFYVNRVLSEWKSGAYPRRAGVTSLGAGGTNVHVVLEEAPRVEASEEPGPWQLLLLSAKTSTALDAATANLVPHLRQYPHLNLADVAYTLQVGRKAFAHRRMAVCQDRDDGVTALETMDPRRVITSFQEPIHRDVVFMFSGQGSQYVNMGLELYKTESRFREQIDLCSSALQPHLSFDLRDVLYPDGENVEEATQTLKQTLVTQPALFVFEYALAKLWMAWGVWPAALAGHSIGEYVAACLAGVFSLEDALSLVAARGRFMQDLPAGSMLAVSLSEREVQPFLNEGLSLAVINSPSLCVVSGEHDAIDDLEKRLSEKDVHCRSLHTSHAFHSEMMEPILEAFAARVGQVRLSPPQIPFVSNVTGTWITPDEAMSPSYWAWHLRRTVRFSDCMQELLKVPDRVLLEVGPGRTISTLAMRHPRKTKEHVVLSSTRHPQEQESDVAFILNTLGRLWLAGIEIDWSGFHGHGRRHRLPLPTYPFERKRYWLSAGKPLYAAASTASVSPEKPEGASLSDRSLSEQRADHAHDAASRNGIERSIADIWHECLGIEQVGVHDNFFEVGGHSLLAAQVISQLRNVFGVKLSMSSFFQAPTVAELAVCIRRAKESNADPSRDRREEIGLQEALRLLGVS
jgi:phthiocerol/phenolphthiocerol synthesis type-I polyketide synthase E